MTELPPEAEQIIADMSAEEVDILLARTRPLDEPTEPKARAAAALRRELGVNRRGTRPSKQAAADALRAYGRNR